LLTHGRWFSPITTSSNYRLPPQIIATGKLYHLLDLIVFKTEGYRYRSVSITPSQMYFIRIKYEYFFVISWYKMYVFGKNPQLKFYLMSVDFPIGCDILLF
jgi:hypothetical protein